MKYKVLMIIALIAYASTLTAQNRSERRSYEQSFLAGPRTEVLITNKYGNVEVHHTDKDSVTIKVEVEAYAPNSTRIRKMMDGINISITETPTSIRGTTSFEQSITDMVESFKGLTSGLIPYESKVTINYTVSLPRSVRLNIDNRYGDVIIDNHRAPLSMSVSNGSLRAGRLGPDTRLFLSFCNANIEEVAGGSIELNYSELGVVNAGNLNIVTRSSTLNVDSAGLLVIDSRRDKFFIDKLTHIKGVSYFSDFIIHNLETGVDMEMKYGTFNADISNDAFKTIDLATFYTYSYIAFPKGSSFTLDAHHTNADLRLAPEMSGVEERTMNQEKKEYLWFGTIGGKKSDRVVKLDINRGSMKLKYR